MAMVKLEEREWIDLSCRACIAQANFRGIVIIIETGFLAF